MSRMYQGMRRCCRTSRFPLPYLLCALYCIFRCHKTNKDCCSFGNCDISRRLKAECAVTVVVTLDIFAGESCGEGGTGKCKLCFLVDIRFNEFNLKSCTLVFKSSVGNYISVYLCTKARICTDIDNSGSYAGYITVAACFNRSVRNIRECRVLAADIYKCERTFDSRKFARNCKACLFLDCNIGAECNSC